MANSGFKGAVVLLERVELLGTSEVAGIAVNVQFADSEGRVHGVTAHKISLNKESDPDLYEAAEVLHNLLKERITALHFTDPDGGARVTKEEVAHGIRESLRGGADTPDGVGRPG